MLWVLVDILIGLLAVALLVVAAIALFQHVKALGRAAKSAGRRIGEVTTQLESLQRQGAHRRLSAASSEEAP